MRTPLPPSLARPLAVLAGAMAVSLSSGAAHAESLRCTGGIADEGDSRMAVLFKCGQPLMKDASCAPVYWRGSPEPLPEPLARAWVPCQPVEDWLYDRGPGSLMATVRFGNGQVRSIVYGRVPR